LTRKRPLLIFASRVAYSWRRRTIIRRVRAEAEIALLKAAEPFETRPAKPAICISLKLSRVSDSMTVRDGHLVPLIKRPYAGTAGKTHEDPRLASCWGNSRRRVLEEPAFDRQGG
jgi:hypothetical protein